MQLIKSKGSISEEKKKTRKRKRIVNVKLLITHTHTHKITRTYTCRDKTSTRIKNGYGVQLSHSRLINKNERKKTLGEKEKETAE